MGFFATFWTWLNGQLATYIGDNTARLAAALEPAVVTLATVYVMAWGYLHLTGKVEEPLVTGLKRILVLAGILGIGLRLWLYNTIIVDTFYHAPAELAAAIVGSTDPVASIDMIWDKGGAVAGNLWTKAGFFRDGGWGFGIAGAVVWCLVGMLCVYAMFLIALSSIALAVLLALGPLFVVSLLFTSTRRFFGAWIVQLANYGLITILTILTGALLLQIVQSFATQTAARGAEIQTVDALNMMLVAVLVFLILRQVMPIASALAGGIALNSHGLVSRSVERIAGTGRAIAGAIGGRSAVYSARGLSEVYGGATGRAGPSPGDNGGMNGSVLKPSGGKPGAGELSTGWQGAARDNDAR